MSDLSGNTRRDGEPVRDQTTIDRLWVTTVTEAMIKSGPPATEQQGTTSPVQNTKEPTKK